MFTCFQKLLIILFFCTIPIAAMERRLLENTKAAVGVSILAYLCRKKANDELLNVIETDVIPCYQKQEEYSNRIKTLMQNSNIKISLDTIEVIENEIKMLIYIKNQYMITEKSFEKIKKCLQNGADSNITTKIPLFLLAVKEQKRDIFNLLLRRNVDINKSADISIDDIECGYTSLHFMVNNFTKNPGSSGIQIEDLLQNGANPNVLNNKKESPLELAVTLRRDIDFIKPLINYHADVNYKDSVGMSILNLAIYYNKKPTVIGVLCDAGADLTDVDDQGNTAFHVIAKNKIGINKNEELIKTIITHGRVDLKKNLR